MCKKRMSNNSKEGENMPTAIRKKADINFNGFLAKNRSKIRQVANANTSRNEKGQTVLKRDDEWRTQTEWDRHYEELNRRGK